MKQQGDLIFEILDKKPAFWAAPISLFDAIIGGLSFFGKWFDGAEDAAELARIGEYVLFLIRVVVGWKGSVRVWFVCCVYMCDCM